jgi:hypothetical protein
MAALDIKLAARATNPKPIEEGVAGPQWRVLDRLEKTAIGTRRAGGVVTVRRREPASCLLFGPYWQLPAGNYRLRFRCRSGRPRMPGQPVLGVEIIAMNRVQLAWLDLTAEELEAETGSLAFTVPPVLGLGAGDESRLEFRFFHMGNAALTIGEAELLSKDETEHEPPPRRWRLLGRLERSLIAKHTADGVTIRQAARPGPFLDGGRPFLQLPRGRYRLSFRCVVGTARMPSQPVLGVEVLASRRWREGRFWDWRPLVGMSPQSGIQQSVADFTEMELQHGCGSVGFIVPAGLSLESGQEVLFGFRFVHFRNADLTIGAVELEQAAENDASPVLRREWRLLGRLNKGAIGARAAEGVRVRRDEPAGALLYGGRPDLLLAPGAYQLSFCCRAGPPRNISEPVLAVEVAARARLLEPRLRPSIFGPRSLVHVQRAFTAEELQSGSATIDFAVPTVLSDDRDQGVRVEFRFKHLANADLEISAVTLREAGPAEPFSIDQPRGPAKTKRTKILIIGNCQAQSVHEAFARTGALNSWLDARYHFVGLQTELHELGRTELEEAEVLLVQDIRDWEQYPLRPYVREDLRIVKFPLLHFASLWPFDHYNGPGDREAYEREWPNLTFLYQDGLLARLRKEIPDPKQRLDAYRSLSLDGVVNYVRLHDFEKRRLTAMDQQFGLEIGRFILDNFQQRQLFYTTNHPNGQITGMLMRYLLKELEINDVHPSAASLDHLKRLQVPVHPKVAKALGVKWAGERTRYLYGGERITWETYVKRYIEHYG